MYRYSLTHILIDDAETDDTFLSTWYNDAFLHSILLRSFSSLLFIRHIQNYVEFLSVHWKLIYTPF
jgi:hypothetical protein